MIKLTKNTFLLGLLILPVLFSSCSDDEIKPPYLMYSSLVTQVNTGDPTESVLKNDLNLTITWTRTAAGRYEGALSRSIDVNKTTIYLRVQELDGIAVGGFKDGNTIQLQILNRYNPYDTRDGMTNAPLQILEFDTPEAMLDSNVPKL